VLAGVFVAIAAQILLSAFGVAVGFGTATVTSLAALRSVSLGVAVWTGISAVIASFIGGYVASRMVDVQFTSDGIWHGVVVWAFALIAGILFGLIGGAGLLGLAANSIAALRTGIPATIGGTVATTLARDAGYFLLGSLLSLAAAVLGGWLGSARMSRSRAMSAMSRERMAA
jgi:hypothetical protein